MNKNHYDPMKIYSSKISRINTILQRIEEAEKIAEKLSEEEGLQARWMQAIWSTLPDPTKTKSINKGYLKNSIKKTLANLKIQQNKMLAQIRKRLEEIDEQAQKNEEQVMRKLKEFVQSLANK